MNARAQLELNLHKRKCSLNIYFSSYFEFFIIVVYFSYYLIIYEIIILSINNNKNETHLN